MSSEKLFLLGLGNQKCGTTWLHRYLSQHDVFDGGWGKEYHVWDALDTPLKIDSYVPWWRVTRRQGKEFRRFRMQRSSRYYFDYFSGLYTGGVTVSADITPSYSGLEEPRLTFIRDQFATRGVTVKPIILLRDPVSRIKSAVKFNLSRNRYTEGINPHEVEYADALRHYYKSDHCRLRTCYHLGLSRALQVFGQDRVYVGLYETMFEASEVARLSAFCGVPVAAEFADVYVNKTKSSEAEDSSLDAEIREAYRETYAYCHEMFPQTRDLWSGS